jgi:hypothetical protein
VITSAGKVIQHMKIEDYIDIANRQQEIDGVSLVRTENLQGLDKTAPQGYETIVRWHFSDGSVIHFHDETDTEPGWRGHNRCWKFESIGDKVSKDAPKEKTSKAGNV